MRLIDGIRVSCEPILFPVEGTIYITWSKYGYCFFHKNVYPPFGLLRIENGHIVVFLQKIAKKRNDPCGEQFLYEFLFDNQKIYLFSLYDIRKVLV
jgi:hypothetical protein